MADYTDQFKQLGENNRLLGKMSPDVMKAFGQVHGEVIKDAALDKKTKELISLGIAIAVRCEGCILSHTRSCVMMGATLEEIAEVVNVAIMMGGGPSTVYGAKALDVANSLIEK